MNMQVRRPSLEALYREVDNFTPKKEKLQPPRIGISSNRKDGLSCIAETYVQSVLQAGGAPVLIPVITDIEAITAIVSGLDGLLMSGGGDMNPLYVSEEPVPQLQDVDTFRDEFDLILLRLATNRQLPVMGICRGHQIINVAFGGSVYQDIYSQHEGKLIKHSQTLSREYASHSVRITDPTSRLFEILKKETNVLVNSFHHQAVKEVAPEFRETAVAPDGINEAMEHPEKEIFSVQWHPEAMASNGDELMLELFKHHVESARLFKEAKRIHKRNVILDSHTDTPMIFPGQFNLGEKEGGKVNLPLMEEGLVDAAIMVAYIPQGKRDDASLHQATDFAINRLNEIHRQMEINRGRMNIAHTPQEVWVTKDAGKKAIMLGVENSRHGTALPGCLNCHWKSQKSFHIRLFKGNLPKLCKIKSLTIQVSSFRIIKGILNRQTHIRRSQLRHNTSVLKFHHRVNDALRLYHYLDPVKLHIKKPFCFHHFQSLVDKSCRIYCDLLPHYPVRML